MPPKLEAELLNAIANVVNIKNKKKNKFHEIVEESRIEIFWNWDLYILLISECHTSMDLYRLKLILYFDVCSPFSFGEGKPNSWYFSDAPKFSF